MAAKKTALITGATGGIGEALCRVLASRGYALVLTARSKEKLLLQAKRLRAAYGAQVLIIPEDLASPGAPLRLYNQLGLSGAGVNLLVNCAGFGAAGYFHKGSQETQEAMLRVNIDAPTQLSRLFLRQMLAKGEGAILNIASTGGFVPGPMNAVYCASKAYLLQLGQALSHETKGTGVSVTTVCPGATRTNFARRAKMESTVLFNHMVLSPMQVARAAVRAMEQKREVAVVGLGNQALMFATRLVPRSVAAALSGMLQRPR